MEQLLLVLFSTTEVIVIVVFTGNRVDIIIVVDVIFSQVVTTVGRVSTGGEALTFSVFSGAVKAFDGGGSASIIADTFLKPL